ncbi:hypothetical protein [Streptomyces albidus (ex Kaewkla and Franco 2022)]|uniref:hypothetical protein n=1 Tax=Streptomyces albidus (ex Kaewkla and Franco 2022) TaxID=722709 RepID=UPI0015EF2A38|nr:hypothetical protein [Streptomyces albidus (ex Kaewkla and Franco 2022)]
MSRLRIQYSPCRPGLILTDTPRPNCWACHGNGGHEREYGHPETGEYDGSDWEPCPCWDHRRGWTVLPLPWTLLRLLRRKPRGGYSSEPPF